LQKKKEEQVAKKEFLPVGLELRQNSNQFSATYPWFSNGRMIRAMAAPLVCLLTSMFMFWGVFGNDGFSFLLDFVLLILAVGLLVYGSWTAYLMICIVLNSTTVNITRDELKVIHSPIPARGNQIVKCFDISELSIEEKKEKWLSGDWEIKSSLYQLKAQLRNGSVIVLLSGPKYEIIHRLQQGIENFIASMN
jgi:fumarate reductase subunit D